MQPNHFDSLIFDLDGTLWGTSELCATAWNIAIAKEIPGYRKVTSQILGSGMGLTSEELREKILGDLPADQGRRLLKACFEQEIRLLRDQGGALYPGVEKGLTELSKVFSIYIVSNCDEPYIRTFLAKSNVGKYIKDWECHGRTGFSKAENISQVIQRNHLKSPIYVGDTQGDLLSARSVKIPFVFMEYGFGRVTAADLRFDDFTTFANYFLGRAQ